MTLTTSKKPDSPKNNNSTTNNEEIKERPVELYSSVMYYFIFVIHILFYLSIYIKNPFAIILVVFCGIPFLDYYISMDELNPTKKQEKELKQDMSFKIPVYLSMIVDWITFAYGINHMATNDNGIVYNIGIGFILTIFQTVSINASHELMHKPNKIENTIAAFTLIKNLYIHFFIEHNYGHHKWVATPIDPASAVKGQTFYDFFPKSLKGGYKSAWNIEVNRLKENNYPFFYNKMIYAYAILVIYPLSLYYFFGFKVMAIACIVGYCGNIVLELINYIEHYGLRRKEESPGVYEVVNIFHSWNAPHRITNYFLFKLQRHSDHHANALKPYQILSSYKESPMLPHGYSICIMIAMFPSVWFYIIDPLVDAYTKNKKVSEEIYKEAEKKCMVFLNKATFVFFGLAIMQYCIINYM